MTAPKSPQRPIDIGSEIFFRDYRDAMAAHEARKSAPAPRAGMAREPSEPPRLREADVAKAVAATLSELDREFVETLAAYKITLEEARAARELPSQNLHRDEHARALISRLHRRGITEAQYEAARVARG